MADTGAAFTLAYMPEVAGDLRVIGPDAARRVRQAIIQRLVLAPHQYGRPLGGSLEGFRRLRVGDYRVVFRVQGGVVEIFLVAHRRLAYEAAIKRILKP